MLVAAFNITQDRLSRSRLAGDPPDVSLTLRTPGLSLFDFARAEEAITAGRDAADPAMPEIERMLSRSLARRADIRLHIFGFPLDGLYPEFNDVADRYHSTELSVLDHGQVADAVIGH